MGTPAIVNIFNKSGKTICHIWQMHDGYVDRGLGQALVEVASNAVYVDHIPQEGEFPIKFPFMGMEDLAAQLLGAQKKGEVGGAYLVAPEDSWDTSYTYTIEPDGYGIKVNGWNYDGEQVIRENEVLILEEESSIKTLFAGPKTLRIK
jgi:hypothetical protein